MLVNSKLVQRGWETAAAELNQQIPRCRFMEWQVDSDHCCTIKSHCNETGAWSQAEAGVVHTGQTDGWMGPGGGLPVPSFLLATGWWPNGNGAAEDFIRMWQRKAASGTLEISQYSIKWENWQNEDFRIKKFSIASAAFAEKKIEHMFKVTSSSLYFYSHFNFISH